MKKLLLAGLVLASLASVALADGPETGVVSGSLTDNQGRPLPGVMITIEGQRGIQSAMTDAIGHYRFALLPPGSYKLKAELEGFRSVEAVANVVAGGKAEIDLELSLETAETITVTSEAPMVDKFNVTAGATVTSDIGVQTAGSTRNYYGVINTLPGVASDAENNDIQQSRPSVNGSHWADNSVFIDGVDTSFARFGGSRVYIPTTAITEVTMEAGGASAEYGRVVGSSTNVIVRSGTNKFHGEANITHQQVDWGADYKAQPLLEQRQEAPAPADFFRRTDAEKEGDTTGYELSVGGPLKQDKAWFFLAWSQFDSNDLDKTLNGDAVDVSLNNEARIAKFNFQPGTAHQIAVSWIDTPASRNYFNPESADKWTPTPHVQDGTLASLNWNYSVSSSMFLETKLATQKSNENKYLAATGDTDVAAAIAIKQQDPRFPGNPALGEHYPGNNYRVYVSTQNDGSWHNGWILDNGFGSNEFPRDQANASLTQFVSDNHELKYGVDWQTVKWESEVQRTGFYSGDNFNAFTPFGFDDCGLVRDAFGLGGGTCVYVDYNPDDVVAAGKGSGDSKNEDIAVYARDRFTVGDHWTFNVGLRVEQAENTNDVGRVVLDDTNVSPRFVGTYDVGGNGRQLVSLNLGRYYAQLNQEWTNEWMHEDWNGYNAADVYLYCDALDTVFLPQCGGQVGYDNFLFSSDRPGRFFDLVDQGLFDWDLDAYYKDEVILGYEWQFTRNWALDVKGIYWELGDIVSATQQRSPDNQPLRMVANSKDIPQILRAIGIVDEAAISQYQEASKEYRSLQVQLNRRFANGFSWFNNVTWSDVETTGSGAWWSNVEDDYGADLGTVLTEEMLVQCNAEQGLDSSGSPIPGASVRNVPINCFDAVGDQIGTPLSLINRLGGDRITDKPIIINSFGYKTWNLGKQSLTLGGHLNFTSGMAWGRTESIDLPDFSSATSLDTSLALRLEPTGARRLDETYQLNLSGAWGFPLGREDLRGQFRIEVLNVTDEQEQLYVTSRGEVRRVRRDFQKPRQIRALFSFSI